MKPLADIRIIAVEQYGAGPFGSVHLADLGAEVIKIEEPQSGGDVGRYIPPYNHGEDSLFFESFNRGKRSLSLDLASPAGLRDARAVVCPALRGLCVAKANTVEQLAEIAAVAEEAEGGGGVELVPLLETAQAILSAPALAAAPRVSRLQIGEADLAAEIGVTPGGDERELLHVRSAVVLASAAAGIEPPAAAVTTDFRDLDRLRRSTLALKRLGFRGRACIHPAQIPVVNEVFTPSVEELAAAHDLMSRFEAAGGGVCLDPRGRMVDLAVVRAARRTLRDGGRAMSDIKYQK